MYEGPDDAWIVDWVTVWDTQADADEFSGRVNEIQDPVDGPIMISGSVRVSTAPLRVCVVAASGFESIDLAPACPAD